MRWASLGPVLCASLLTVSSMVPIAVADVGQPPVITDIPIQMANEDVIKKVDLAPYVSDGDTPAEDLVLNCSHPAVVSVDGLTIRLLYNVWQAEHTIEFTVSDGGTSVNGSFIMRVRELNDAPRILDVGGMTPPFNITMYERTERWLPVTVVDEDSDEFVCMLSSDCSGFKAPGNGTLHLIASESSVGEHEVRLTVSDLEQGSSSITFNVTVLDVNDPPTVLFTTSPVNHTVVVEGQNVTFSAQASDLDTVHGQVLTVTWTSNVSGVLRELTSEDDLTFVVVDLPVGMHNVTVTVSDGEFTKSVWLEVRVIARPPPSPPSEGQSTAGDESGWGAVLVALAVVVVLAAVVALLMVTKRGRPSPSEDVRATEGQVRSIKERATSIEDEHDALYGVDYGRR